MDDLRCPISLDLLEDPINTPCCGQAFSRKALISHLKLSNTCAICRVDIKQVFPGFNAADVPRNVNIAGLVEKYAKENSSSPRAEALPKGGLDQDEERAEDLEPPEWACRVTQLVSPDGTLLPVGRLKVDVSWPQFKGECCLFIPVIDKSGSMAGSAFAQVQTALLHMLSSTLSNRNVFSSFILYDSRARKIQVPRDGSAETARWKAVENEIRQVTASGGTNFDGAFRLIREILVGDTSGGKVVAQAFERDSPEDIEQRRLGRLGLLVKAAPAFVRSAVIVFMTDGQDNSSKSTQQLTLALKKYLSAWTKKVVVHTIGFSRGHDFKFLDNLRKVGSEEGTFRYADPQDDGDTLCGKLSDLADSIISGTALSVGLRCPYRLWSETTESPTEEPAAPSPPGGVSVGHSSTVQQYCDVEQGCGSLEIFVHMDMHPSPGTQVANLSVLSGETPDQEVVIETVDAGNDPDAWQSWLAKLADRAMQEVVSLTSKSAATQKQNSFKLHCTLLLQRMSYLEVALGQKEARFVEKLRVGMGQVQLMLHGKQADVMKLNDIAQAAAVPPAAKTTHRPYTRAYKPVPKAPDQKLYKEGSRGTIYNGRRKALGPLHAAVLGQSIAAVAKVLEAHPDEVQTVHKDTGDSPLIMAAAIGRLNAARLLIPLAADSLHKANKAQCTPLAMAALRGYWKMVDLLLSHNARLHGEMDRDRLLQTVLHRKHYHTAGRLLAAGIGSIQPGMLKGRLPPETLQWVMQKQAENEMSQASVEATSPEQVATYLRKAVENGMAPLVADLATKVEKIDPSLLGLCGWNKQKGVEVARELLKAGVPPDALEADSGFSVLFESARKGWMGLLELLIEHQADVNWQDPKGNTALIAACARKDSDAITALLNAGADPNLANHKGNVPLVKACDKNHCAGVAALLAGGAEIHMESTAVNTPVLTCCRVGHPEILTTLLKTMQRRDQYASLDSLSVELAHVADIDGFNAIFAAVESDNVECIKVLLEFGANLADRTAANNAIIAGATPLALAAHYGRVASALCLLERQADPNAQDAHGRTPLHTAVRQQNIMVVRLLRQYKVNASIKDLMGRVAAFYCAEDSAIRQELEDPALRMLMAAARDPSDIGACQVVRAHAGLLGCLSPAVCVEIDSGDLWTPLMEAVVFDNMSFASSLVSVGADLHRKGPHGLSAAFWAKMLYRDVTTLEAFSLTPFEEACVRRVMEAAAGDVRNAMVLMFDGQKPPNFQSKAASLGAKMRQFVNCVEACHLPSPKNSCAVVGFLSTMCKVSSAKGVPANNDALNELLMKGRLFAIAAVAANCEPETIQDEAAEAEPEPAGAGKKGTKKLKKKGKLSKKRTSGKKKRSKKAKGKKKQACQSAASAASPDEIQPEVDDSRLPQGISFQQVLALYALVSDLAVFTRVNTAMTGARKLEMKEIHEDAGSAKTDKWTPFIQMLLLSLEALPAFQGEVFRGVSSMDLSKYAKGSQVSWPGFTSTSEQWSLALESDTGTRNQIIFLIKTRSARRVSAFSRCPQDAEVLILPNTTFTVTNCFLGDVIGLGQANIRASAFRFADEELLARAIANNETIVVELSEV